MGSSARRVGCRVGTLSSHTIAKASLLIQGGIRVKWVDTSLPPDDTCALLHSKILGGVSKVDSVVPWRIVHAIELFALEHLASTDRAICAVVVASLRQGGKSHHLVCLLVIVCSACTSWNRILEQSSLLEVVCEVELDRIVSRGSVGIRIVSSNLKGRHVPVGRLCRAPRVWNR